MFDKLISRFQREKTPGHPLASDAGLDALVDGMPQSDPARTLLDVDELLDNFDATVAEIGHSAALHALDRLDQFSREHVRQLLARYLSAGEREYLSDSAWSTLAAHAAQLFRRYRSFLDASPPPAIADEKLRMARWASRALMAWALRKKLQRFRYRTPDAGSWQDAHELLQTLGRLGLLKMAVVPYRNEAETTPLAEYLIGLYLELVPVGNMIPQQLEFADAFLRSCGGLDLVPQPHEQSTDRIDLDEWSGPRRIRKGDQGGGRVFFCSTRKLRGGLMDLATRIKKPQDVPEWMGHVAATSDQIEGAILILVTHWAPAPPKRRKDRVIHAGELHVVLGFGLARRMIAAAHFARQGRSLKYEGDDINRLFDETRFGTVAAKTGSAEHAEAEARRKEVPMSPIEILRKLETGGDKAQMETWLLVDDSATGLGAIAPAILSRHRIGLLVCLREADGLDWRLGLMRRIGRDGNNRPSIGIETLPWPSVCAMAKPVGEESAWTRVADGGHGWTDAILVEQGARELILPTGTHAPGMEIDLRSELGLWRLRLESLLDRGPDYDRIQFTRVS